MGGKKRILMKTFKLFSEIVRWTSEGKVGVMGGGGGWKEKGEEEKKQRNTKYATRIIFSKFYLSIKLQFFNGFLT